MELTTLIRVWVRRLPFIALLGLLCGLGAWLVGGGQSKVYEQTLGFVLRPADGLPVEEADRVAGTLADRDSAITQTILGVVQSVPVTSGSGQDDVERTITLRPGSNIIDVELEGDEAAVAAAGRSFLTSAPERVSRSYNIYALESLGTPAAPARKPSAFLRTLALAVLLGGALALGVAVLEYRVRGRPATDGDRGEAEAEWAPLFEEGEEEPEPVRTRSAKR